MKVGFIGSVNSSMRTLQKLVQHDVKLTAVYGYKPSSNMVVSGYCDLESYSMENNLPFVAFTKVNDHVEAIKDLQLDILFVVGLSQLVSQEIIDSVKVGCIGFHPTNLPEGRGRAPLAWLIEEKRNGAATFFVIDNEPDAGPILVQSTFQVSSEDTVAKVEDSMLTAIDTALDQLLPELKQGLWDPKPQDKRLATEYGVRKPEDGVINWNLPANKIHRLIKAASHPHPGAFTFLDNQKLFILDSVEDHSLPIKGIEGRILKVKKNAILVQCGEGLLWLTVNREDIKSLKVGAKLGYQVDIELYKLKSQISEIQKMLGNKL